MSTESIYVAGHRGLVGSATVRALRDAGFRNILTRTRAEVDLTKQDQVDAFFREQRPRYVILAAARVGGILANQTRAADFITDNLRIQTNVIEAAFRSGVERLLFLGSSCVYPKYAAQPLRESSLLTGELEPTNQAYAVAKIAGIEMCFAFRRQYGADFVVAMPANLYGPGDRFDLKEGHVLAALLRKFHEAKAAGASSVEVWGTGTPRREFLHADDAARALVTILVADSPPPIVNIGSGSDVTVTELALLIRDVVGFEGDIVYDHARPDGTPRKLLECSRIRSLGWAPRFDLREGILDTYNWYLENENAVMSNCT